MSEFSDVMAQGHLLLTFSGHQRRCGYDHRIDYEMFYVIKEYFEWEHSSNAVDAVFEYKVCWHWF